MALAATARVHGLVIVTRNVSDFTGRGVRILDPFKSPQSFWIFKPLRKWHQAAGLHCFCRAGQSYRPPPKR